MKQSLVLLFPPFYSILNRIACLLFFFFFFLRRDSIQLLIHTILSFINVEWTIFCICITKEIDKRKDLPYMSIMRINVTISLYIYISIFFSTIVLSHFYHSSRFIKDTRKNSSQNVISYDWIRKRCSGGNVSQRQNKRATFSFQL